MESTQHFTLTPDQEKIVYAPIDRHIFLQGITGSGKTTAAANRYLNLVRQGVPAENILILVPQRTLAYSYYKTVHQYQVESGGMPDILTLGGLARRMIDLFFPAIGGLAGFAAPDSPPTFLTMETAQYYLSNIISPMRDEQYFEAANLDINRLSSQVLDTLNKAAVIGFDHTTVGERLKSAWIGKPEQLRLYDDAQEAANLFRRYCLDHNLIDFSLQYEIFSKYVWHLEICRDYLRNRYRCLIYDNIEEDVPLAHDLVKEWLPEFASALLLYDIEGGFRLFLGADPESGYTLKDYCDEEMTFTGSWITNPAQDACLEILSDAIQGDLPELTAEVSSREELESVLDVRYMKFMPELVDSICREISKLVNEEGVPPGEIVLLSPYLSDALRFTISNRLSDEGIPLRSFRPSRSLIDEPAVRCLLTLIKIAHPRWELSTNKFEIRYALIQSISGLDLVRADLLANIVYRKNSPCNLSSFDQIMTDKQDRISFVIGERFEKLRKWLVEYLDTEPVALDVFVTRLFGEVLSQPGFNFHTDFDAADAVARLVESIQKFRQGINDPTEQVDFLGNEYMKTLEGGVLAAQSPLSWTFLEENAVLIAPAYTFLMSNYPAKIQYWLDIGSMGWWERLNQPLTHPYVLSRHWHQNDRWTDVQEFQHNQESLVKLVTGLIRRCSGKVVLCAVGVDEQGNEKRGPLLRAIQTLRRHFYLPA